MTGSTTNLGLTTYNTITDGSTLFATYIEAISGSSSLSDMGKIDNFAGTINGSFVSISASLTVISASIITINTTIAPISSSPISVPFIELSPESSIPPFSGIQSAALEFSESSSTATNKPVKPQLRFDPDTDEGREWNFRIPATITGSQCTINIHGMMEDSNTSKTLCIVAQFACYSVGDTSGSAKSYATAQTATVTVPNASYTIFEISIPITSSDNLTPIELML